MLVARGNIWSYEADWVVVTTNGIVKKNGEAVMGRGVARQAKDRFPNLARRLAHVLKRRGNHIAIFEDIKIVTFPTKHNWKDSSSLELIDQSCVEIASLPYDATFVMPKPGCGLGNLTWNQVRPILEKRLDDRFTVVT